MQKAMPTPTRSLGHIRIAPRTMPPQKKMPINQSQYTFRTPWPPACELAKTAGAVNMWAATGPEDMHPLGMELRNQANSAAPASVNFT
jgi:hypothetical protein